jgi:hypothetical protein
MVDTRAKTAEDYVRLVEQAIIEIDEFIACLEFDMDDPGEQLKVLTPLLEAVTGIRKGMADGSYEFENKDLPFMEVANRLSSQLPFTQLLEAINQTHRRGLNIESDD